MSKIEANPALAGFSRQDLIVELAVRYRDICSKEEPGKNSGDPLAAQIGKLSAFNGHIIINNIYENECGIQVTESIREKMP